MRRLQRRASVLSLQELPLLARFRDLEAEDAEFVCGEDFAACSNTHVAVWSLRGLGPCALLVSEAMGNIVSVPAMFGKVCSRRVPVVC